MVFGMTDIRAKEPMVTGSGIFCLALNEGTARVWGQGMLIIVTPAGY